MYAEHLTAKIYLYTVLVYRVHMHADTHKHTAIETNKKTNFHVSNADFTLD